MNFLFLPFQKIKLTEKTAPMSKAIDWAKLSDYEQEDNTSGSQTLSCVSGSCEIVDLT
jgi:hypothetical protein